MTSFLISRPAYFWLTLFLLAFLEVGHASSCCSGGGGQSICVLTSEQEYQIGFSSSVQQVDGRFDPYGNFRPNEQGTSLGSFTTTFGGAYRLGNDWQIALSVPIVRNERSYSNQLHIANGIGDSIAEGRYLLWEDLAFLSYRPQLVFYGGIRLPTGRSVYDSSGLTEVDVTGDGYVTLHAGASLAKLKRPLSFGADASIYYPMSKEVSAIRGNSISPYIYKAGNKVQLTEAISYLQNEKISYALGLKQQLQFESTVSGTNVAGSAARLYTTTASLNYYYSSNLNFTFSFETPYPFESFSVNQARAQSLSVSLFYGGS